MKAQCPLEAFAYAFLETKENDRPHVFEINALVCLLQLHLYTCEDQVVENCGLPDVRAPQIEGSNMQITVLTLILNDSYLF